MADEQRWTDTLEKFFEAFARNIHTIKPGVVLNIIGTTASVKILSKTRMRSGVQEPFPDIVSVPVFTLQAQRGSAHISMPVMAGDNVVVLFSDRSMGTLLRTVGTSAVDSPDSKTHPYEPIIAFPWLFTFPNVIPPNTGNISITNGGSKIDIAPNGTINMIGDVSIIGNLSVNGVDFLTHTHDGVTSGSDPTGPVTPIP